jgi:membrane-bound serine protease (ClpP class)
MRVKWVTALAVSIPLGLISAFLMTIALRARRNKVMTGEQGLVGEIGVVQAPLTPSGKVFVQGELWDAISPTTVDVGRNVVIRKVQDLKLYVEPETSERTAG